MEKEPITINGLEQLKKEFEQTKKQTQNNNFEKNQTPYG